MSGFLGSAKKKLDKGGMSMKDIIPIIRDSRTKVEDMLEDGLDADEVGAIMDTVVKRNNVIWSIASAIGVIVAFLFYFGSAIIPDGVKSTVDNAQTMGKFIAPDKKPVYIPDDDKPLIQPKNQ